MLPGLKHTSLLGMQIGAGTGVSLMDAQRKYNINLHDVPTAVICNIITTTNIRRKVVLEDMKKKKKKKKKN